MNPTVARFRDSTEKSSSDKKTPDPPLILLTEQNEIVDDYEIAVTTKAAKDGGGRVLFSQLSSRRNSQNFLVQKPKNHTSTKELATIERNLLNFSHNGITTEDLDKSSKSK